MAHNRIYGWCKFVKTSAAFTVNRDSNKILLFKIVNPHFRGSLISHIAFIEKNNSRLVLNKFCKVGVTTADRNSCINNFCDSINKFKT